MNKRSLTIEQLINPIIKVGDKVKLIDGSSLSINIDSVKDKQLYKDYYIVRRYPEITGDKLELQHQKFIVKAINITNKCTNSIHSLMHNIVYLQDIIIEINNIEFRIASKHVRLINK